jgi:hypothetical protein
MEDQVAEPKAQQQTGHALTASPVIRPISREPAVERGR